jgi:hypothetical protein
MAELNPYDDESNGELNRFLKGEMTIYQQR